MGSSYYYRWLLLVFAKRTTFYPLKVCALEGPLVNVENLHCAIGIDFRSAKIFYFDIR
tara:strand:+ start:1972 stop:2145 length:174 start_codon:yes stop_codon:yes gene_type:complete